VKKVIAITIVMILAAVYITGFHEYLTFEHVHERLDEIKSFKEKSPTTAFLLFFTSYVLLTSLSIPGAIVLTLLSGAIFGLMPGLLIVSIASCIGATISFCLSRYLFRDHLIKKWDRRFREIDGKFREHGKMYLFSLRMIPISPFVVINLLMGLTTIKLRSYMWITFVGMMPGTFVYIYAGRKIADISSLSEVLTWPIALVLTILGAMPLITSWIKVRLPT
jgi:uncharacterized membrane protein YdjX (TVP38/TMEM64 family)